MVLAAPGPLLTQPPSLFFLPPEDPYPVLLRPNSTQRESGRTFTEMLFIGTRYSFTELSIPYTAALREQV